MLQKNAKMLIVARNIQLFQFYSMVLPKNLPGSGSA